MATRKRANFTASSAAANQVVAGVASKQIRVFNYFIAADKESDIPAAGLDYTWQDDSGSTNIVQSLRTLQAGEGHHGFTELGRKQYIGETAIGDDLDILLGSAVAVHGWVEYEEV